MSSWFKHAFWIFTLLELASTFMWACRERSFD